jgi:hypothetical protein
LLRLAAVLRRHAAMLQARAATLELEAHADMAAIGVEAVERARGCETPELAAEQVAEVFLSLAGPTPAP